MDQFTLRHNVREWSIFVAEFEVQTLSPNLMRPRIIIESLVIMQQDIKIRWWRHQMETFSVLLAFCDSNPMVTGGFPHKGQWHRVWLFPLRCAWTNVWTNSGSTIDLGHNMSLWQHCNAPCESRLGLYQKITDASSMHICMKTKIRRRNYCTYLLILKTHQFYIHVKFVFNYMVSLYVWYIL